MIQGQYHLTYKIGRVKYTAAVLEIRGAGSCLAMADRVLRKLHPNWPLGANVEWADRVINQKIWKGIKPGIQAGYTITYRVAKRYSHWDHIDNYIRMKGRDEARAYLEYLYQDDPLWIEDIKLYYERSLS